MKGHSPTASGLQLTPMMAGLLVTSILSGNLISRTGRYKPFPIAGTALMTVAVFLLSRLEVGTPTWVASADMVLLGLGLGMVMQVLVLAAQNAVDYRLLGVATSGSTLFRQIGGSIGVSAFGAIFANRLGDELAARLPAGVHAPTVANPAVIRALPPALHQPFVEAFAVSLQPVFVAASGISLVAFVLTWWLREVPLRVTVPDGGRRRGRGLNRRCRGRRGVALTGLGSRIGRKGMWTDVPSYTVNDAGVAHARTLIDARQYVLESRWGDVQPRAEDESAFLEAHSWAEYAAWHLGLTEGAGDETKGRYAFVYGDFRRVHRMGLIACLYRAAEWRHKAVERAAYDLLQHLDGTSR